jgi:pyroglutamyl-peptidase
MNLLVTGFGPFLSVDDNPSARLARNCGADHRILEVAYEAVDAFLVDPSVAGYEAILLMGVARREYVSLETTAKNFVGTTPDVRGVVKGPGSIIEGGAEGLLGNLWPTDLIEEATGDLVVSSDAGSYLCNYIYHEALRRLPDARVGFLHVAPFDLVSEERQKVILAGLLRRLSR